MGWQGRGDEVEAVLGDFDPDGADELLTARWGCVRAVNLFFNCGQVEQARQVLADVRDRVDSEAIVSYVTAMEVVFSCFSGDVPTRSTPASPCAHPMCRWRRCGRLCDVLGVGARRAVWRRSPRSGCGAASGALAHPGGFADGLAEVMALTAAGDYLAAERV